MLLARRRAAPCHCALCICTSCVCVVVYILDYPGRSFVTPSFVFVLWPVTPPVSLFLRALLMLLHCIVSRYTCFTVTLLSICMCSVLYIYMRRRLCFDSLSRFARVLSAISHVQCFPFRIGLYAFVSRPSFSRDCAKVWRKFAVYYAVVASRVLFLPSSLLTIREPDLRHTIKLQL